MKVDIFEKTKTIELDQPMLSVSIPVYDKESLYDEYNKNKKIIIHEKSYPINKIYKEIYPSIREERSIVIIDDNEDVSISDLLGKGQDYIHKDLFNLIIRETSFHIRRLKKVSLWNRIFKWKSIVEEIASNTLEELKQ